MVKRLSARLEPFAGCEARQMDGEALALADGSVDVAFSIFGVILFADWRRGLREQARVVRSGGKACVATWRSPPGGGPFHVMAAALRAVFPDRVMPQPEGLAALSDPVRLGDELRQCGFTDVAVHEVEGVWEGPAGAAYLEEMKGLHGYLPPYAALAPSDRAKVDDAIRSFVGANASDGKVRLRSPALIAVGTRR